MTPTSPIWTERDEKSYRLLNEKLRTQRERDELAFICTENFKDFVREAWSTVEPARGYISTWHVDAICEHLEAVSSGQIKRLIINQPPGTAKSLLVSVLWPAWWWVKDAKKRFMCSSYAESLSLRDAVRCRTLIESPWYQNLFRPKWKLKGDTNKKELYETTLSGFRFSHSVGSKATGFRGDCIHGDSIIQTDQGPIPIRDIVQQKLGVKVFGSAGYCDIKAYTEIAGRGGFEIAGENGSVLVVTGNHPIYIEGLGYVQARELARMSRGEIRLRSGVDGPIYLANIRPCAAPDLVYNLQVGGNSDYYANDILTHNCQIIDDPINAKDQYSEAALLEAQNWLDQVMSSRFNDQAAGMRVLVMQRLNERDLSGYALSQGGYEHLMLPSEFEPERKCHTSIGWEDPRTEFGELLFPELFSHEVIEQAKKDLGSTGYSGQHAQRPVPAGGGMLKNFWWNYWQPRGANLPPVPVKMPDGSYVQRNAMLLPMDMDLTIQSWDMAFKDTPKSDFVVGLALAARGADRFVLDMERGRMDLPETLMAVRRLSARHPAAQTKLVEDKANGSAVIQSLKHEIGGLTEVKPEGGKEARAAAASPMLESGQWYLPHPALMPWVADFVKELSDFPAGLNDDIVDAWSQGAARLVSVPAKRSREVVLPPRVYSGERGWMV